MVYSEHIPVEQKHKSKKSTNGDYCTVGKRTNLHNLVTRQLIFDGDDFLQLFFILHNKNVCSAIFGDELASFNRVGWVDPGCNSSSKNCSQISQKPFWRIETQNSDTVVAFETQFDESFGDSACFWNEKVGSEYWTSKRTFMSTVSPVFHTEVTVSWSQR